MYTNVHSSTIHNSQKEEIAQIKQRTGKQIITRFCCSVAKSCLTLHNLMACSTPGFLPCPSLISWSLLKLTSVESVMLFNQPILSVSPFSSYTQSFPASGSFPMSWLFSNELALHIKWPKYWSFSISPSNEYSGLISNFLVNEWFNLLATQESSSDQNSKASVLSRLSSRNIYPSHSL